MKRAGTLDAQELRTWVLYQAMSGTLDAALDRQLQRDASMPHAYYRILARLSASPGKAKRITALAQANLASQSRTSHAVARLEQYGWVRREKTSDDKRGIRVVLTDAGMQVLEAAAPSHSAEVRALVFDHLSPEQVRQLGDICQTLLAVLDPESTAELPSMPPSAPAPDATIGSRRRRSG